ncbi:MAG: hypothetical protein GXX94_05540 [Chloroflexi bacterium]|nr:hypothetical protein [Chloroflexota bacterium]
MSIDRVQTHPTSHNTRGRAEPAGLCTRVCGEPLHSPRPEWPAHRYGTPFGDGGRLAACRRLWQAQPWLSAERAISLLLMYLLYLVGRTRFFAIGGYF